jgi:hypothetical protein
MFKKNQDHKQLAWISNVNDLPEKQRQRLKESWAEVFYRKFFCGFRNEYGPPNNSLERTPARCLTIGWYRGSCCGKMIKGNLGHRSARSR